MAAGSRVCPNCRRLNGADEKVCYNCGQRLSGAVGLNLIASFKQLELPATKLLIFMCLVVFALCVWASAGTLPVMPNQQFPGVTLVRFGASGNVLARLEPWRYLSAVFAHANVLHIGMNLFAMVYVARLLEQAFGAARLVILFVFTGAFGFLASDVWYGIDSGLTIGASGAIFGLFGADVGRLYARRDPNWKTELTRNFVIGLALAIGFSFVNTAAHLGGFVAGAPLGYLFQKERAAWKLGGLIVTLAVLGILLSIASIMLSNASPIWQELRASVTPRPLSDSAVGLMQGLPANGVARFGC